MGREQRLKLHRQRRRTPGQLCIYCDKAPATTSDHVPPKALFPQPRPSNLISVPCCETCRLTQTDEDEHFKNMVLMRDDVATSPHVRPLLSSVRKALARPERRQFTSTLMQSVRDVEIVSEAGLYLGRAKTFRVDVKRLDAVMRRTMLGLYFYETGTRLPDTHGATVFSAAAVVNPTEEQQASLQRLVRAAAEGSVRHMGDGVFTYVVRRFSETPHFSLWVFIVYERVAFIGLTESRDRMPGWAKPLTSDP